MRLNKSKQNEMKNDTIKRGSSFLAVNCQVKSTLTIMCLIPMVDMILIFALRNLLLTVFALPLSKLDIL